MSTATTVPVHGLSRAVAERNAGNDHAQGLVAQIKTRFFRFLEKLPDNHADIDIDAFKRLPVPF